MMKNFFTNLLSNKKRLLIIAGAVVLVGIVVAIVLWLCLKPNGADAYESKLDEFYQVIAAPQEAETFYDGLLGVRDAALAFGDDALDKIGYVRKDLNGDGNDELFIGYFDNDGSVDVKNEIYAAFTGDEESLKPLFEKQKRNTYALTDTGTIYFYGSDEAKYFILAEYQLTDDGDVVCKDFYFTYPKNNDLEKFAFYHNTTGTWDPKASEEIQMTHEEFEQKRKELAARTVSMEDVKFAKVG